ncbi:3'(2'),5'-bisphosphate nucleotidase CysQ [Mycobacterium sp. CBMA271]|uniref:3'(2'),5'-bisphosphate nucleotidase CysQ n=1 Tax=unclassified Mycobacteroides TaxID=2618759 RepID=UPI001326B03F|nr:MULTISPECIES: 3'(2'),5'-bisphosphate nucleotidase CysQ [unclassified Mycobacteroides]MUM22653.1 3'(2'),5'-bisphosphate nucleotidase CysQ [Mycobacteroides sp. CBMA 271]
MTVTDAALAAELAHDAGQLLLQVRAELGFDDPKALGAAGDKRANALLLERLAIERPGDAVLSEEAVDDKVRLGAQRVWIIDPLDGTREFGIEGRDDWAVHVALWQSGPEGSDSGDSITDAAVALPALGTVFRTDETRVTPASRNEADPIRVVVSASRPPKLLTQMAEEFNIELIPMGSAGAKAMAVVRGEADAYLHGGGQWEWDSAAPAGVVLHAGLHASRLDGSPLKYNEPHPYLPDLVMCRPDLAPLLLDAVTRLG